MINSRSVLISTLFALVILSTVQVFSIGISYYFPIFLALLGGATFLKIFISYKEFQKSIIPFSEIDFIKFRKTYFPFYYLMFFGFHALLFGFFIPKAQPFFFTILGILSLLIIDTIYKKFIGFYRVGFNSFNIFLADDSYWSVPWNSINKLNFDGLFNQIIFLRDNKIIVKFSLNKLKRIEQQLFLSKIIDVAKEKEICISKNLQGLEKPT